MKLLVLTSEPISAQQLRGAIGDDVEPQNAEVMVIAPALQESPIKFWFSDADAAIERAERVRRETVERLGDAGVAASSDTGESDPYTAIYDALASFSADRIVLFKHAGDDQRYREDVDPEKVRERFGLPVDQATVDS
jgi:hypothetical protein